MLSSLWKTWFGPFNFNKICMLISVSIVTGLLFLPKSAPCGLTIETQLMSFRFSALAVGAGMAFALVSSYFEHIIQRKTKQLNFFVELLVLIISGLLFAYVIYSFFAALTLLPLMGVQAITIIPSVFLNWLKVPFGDLATAKCGSNSLSFSHLMKIEMVFIFVVNSISYFRSNKRDVVL